MKIIYNYKKNVSHRKVIQYITKVIKEFWTGNIAKAIVTSCKKAGTYVGRVAVRKSASFNVKTNAEIVQGIGWKYFNNLHKMDGDIYT